MNFLMIESLQKFHHYYGDDFRVECPTGSGQADVALGSQRGTLALPDAYFSARRKRPAAGVWRDSRNFRTIPYWRDLILFYEYFHGDTGAGLGAGHQTGWTGLVSKLLEQTGE